MSTKLSHRHTTSGKASTSWESVPVPTMAEFDALAARVAALEAAPDPDPEPEPEPEPTPTGTYGSMVAADTLANTTTDQGPVAYRFISDRSGSLSGVRVYFEVGTGYSGGDGGSRRERVS